MASKLLCSCGGKCDGVCRDKHLHRKRDWTKPIDTCPAVYEKRKTNGK